MVQQGYVTVVMTTWHLGLFITVLVEFFAWQYMNVLENEMLLYTLIFKPHLCSWDLNTIHERCYRAC